MTDAERTTLVSWFSTLGTAALESALTSGAFVPQASTTDTRGRVDVLTGFSRNGVIKEDYRYFCCSNVGPEPEQYVGITAQVDVHIARDGILTVTETFQQTLMSFCVGACQSAFTIELAPDSLRIVGDLMGNPQTINGVQRLRLVGSLTYYRAMSFERKTVDIDVDLGYRTFPTVPISATGQAGPTRLNSTTLPTVSPQRCSLPLEGCGFTPPGPNEGARAACNGYPLCGR